jgi:hypothetical protein
MNNPFSIFTNSKYFKSYAYLSVDMKEERRELKNFNNVFGDLSPNPTGITYISVFDRL